jgi:addiction module HigA family antidote
MGPSLAGFNADWASPLGDLIEEMREEFGWTRAELAQRLDFSAKHVNELLKGRAPITADSAERLERVLGHDAGFWLRLEANYQQDLVRLQQLDQLASQKDWLKELLLRWMQGEGWVDLQPCRPAGFGVPEVLRGGVDRRLAGALRPAVGRLSQLQELCDVAGRPGQLAASRRNSSGFNRLQTL